MTTPNPMLAELDEVVRQLHEVDGKEGLVLEKMRMLSTAGLFIKARHAEIADMAKRLEAAERDAARYALIKKRFDDMTTGKSERFLECLGIDGDVYQPLDAAIDATQEGEG